MQGCCTILSLHLAAWEELMAEGSTLTLLREAKLHVLLASAISSALNTYIASANTHHASSHHLLPPCTHEHSYIMTCEFEWEKTTHTTYVKWLTTFYSRYCHMELIIYSLTDATSYHLSPPHVHMFVHADLWVSTRESYIHTYVQYYLSLIILISCHM